MAIFLRWRISQVLSFISNLIPIVPWEKADAG
jgi:hypothetical protein